MVTNIIITYTLILILNYAFVYSMIYLTFEVLKEYNVEMFFEEVLGQRLSDYYLSLTVKVIVPLYGTIFGLIFLYRYFEAKDEGYKDWYALKKAYKGV